MLIATSPRLSSDQEKKKSTEEAYPVEVDCVPSKCNTGIFCGKRRDIQTHEEHSRHIPNTQSTYEYTTDRIATKQLKELSDNQRTINAQSPVYCNSVKPTIMQSDTQHHTKQPSEPQGEEFIYFMQHAEAKCAELDSSLHTAVQAAEFGNFRQTATVETEESTLKALTVQSEELHSSVQMPTVQSELANSLQTSAVQSEHLTNHLQISTGKSDTFCNSLKTATLQLEEPFKSSHTATVQSQEHFKSLKTATVQSGELCSSTQMPAVQSEKMRDCLQTETVHSGGPSNSLWTATDQPEELTRPLHTSTVQPEKLCDFPNTASIQSLDEYNSKEAETVQPGEHYNSRQTALDDLCHTGRAVPEHSEVLCQSMQATTVRAECHHAVKATEDQVDSTVNSGQRSPTQFAEPRYVKQASTVQSEEIYLSRTCDSHWSDRVTANKVAVEGDLNG